MVTMLLLILLPAAFLLPPGAGAGEIIGGWEARPHSRPYMAYLEIQDGNNFSHCGGFLVSKEYVLTAAHCNGDKITVYLGVHNLKSKQEQSRQVIPVRKKFPHPDYNNNTISNDIMLLQLGGNVKVSKAVSLIKLTRPLHSVRLGTMCSVAGWGMISLTNGTDILHEVNLMVISDQTCKSRYTYYYPSSMLCAGDPNDKKTFYLGDSGGPLVCNGVAEGIVSKCIRNSTAPPGVYTRISHFLPWINSTMRQF